MPSKRHLENRGRRRRNAVQLNDFLRGDETTPSSNQSQARTNESNKNVQNASSIGTIPLNGPIESDVTPVVTTQQSVDQEKASPQGQQKALKPTVNVWLSPGEKAQPEANYNVDTKEYPGLGQRSKRSKQPSPPGPNSDNDDAIFAPNVGQRFRGRRGRGIEPPVLANFLPEAVLPTVVGNKQQTVAKWLASVHPGYNDLTRNSTPCKISLLKRDSAPQHERNAGQSPQKENKSTAKNIQQNTPGNASQQKKATGTANQQQPQQQGSGSASPSLQQQKSPINSVWQQQGSSGSARQQRQKCQGNSAQQQQRKPAGNPVQQQQKSPGTTVGPTKQQQQKTPDNPLQEQERTPPKLQPKSTANPFKQHQKNSGNPFQQQPKSAAQKSPERALQHQQKGPGGCSQQQHQRSPVRQQQQQHPKRSGHPFRQQPKSPEKTPRDDENVDSMPDHDFTDQRSQPPTQTSFAGNNSADDEDDDIVPPTPTCQSHRVMSWRFPRSNNTVRLVRSLQSLSQQFMQSSPEESQKEQAVPRQLQTYVQRQISPHQVKRLPANQPIRHIRQLAMRSALNSNAQEFRPREHRVASGSNQQSQVALGLPEEEEEEEDEDEDVPMQPSSRPTRLSRRRRRQRFLRTLKNATNLLPTSTPSVGLLSPPMMQPSCTCSTPPLSQVHRYAPASAPQPLAQQLPQSVLQPYSQPLSQPPVLQSLPQAIPQLQVQPPLQLLPHTQIQVQPPANIPVQVMIPPETIKLSAGSNPPPVIFYNPQSGNVWSNPTPHIPIEIQSSLASQSVFRLASLPCTGVGTPNTGSFTEWSPPSQLLHSPSCLPSSISGPSQLQFSHTLSSPPPVEEQQRQEDPLESSTYQDEDLLFSRPLLDMDREDTQPEEGEELGLGEYGECQGPREWECGSGWQSESELQASHPPVVDEPHGDPDVVVAKHTGPPLERHQIFRAPPQHGHNYPKPDLNCVPSSIKKLYHLISSQYSDYSFVYALSAQLSQECVPMDCYVYLKMVLLASIVSIETEEVRAPVALCIIATDSLMANRLMNKVGQLAPRFLGPHDYGLHPTFSALPTRFNWVVACPLLMAQQGVYYVGDWTRLTKDQGCQLEKCIENGAVPVPQLQVDQPLEAAVWTHWQPENSSNQALVLSKLCPIFGLPIYMGDQVSESLWNLIIHQHSAEGQNTVNDGLNIHEDDLRMLIHLLHQRKTTFSDGAQQMLQKYYVISRKERPTVFTSKTYIVLKQFAESFAKMALRLEVLESDVCVAIFHCEHFVQSVFGTNEHLAPPAVINFSVIARIDPYMNEFARWLLQYLDRYEDEELGMQPAKRRRTDSWGMP
ncbi:uncharacterized protein LOC108032959 isoform X2 [Drosophila biarmipes]|uniref:uncharacterized protein LOC108032959 isoform X2 n=1 Tax=Drosophila biarmipes TaxID=125945 RepID=UPI001CDB1E4C|nr:uncharacterized protein LOC108032959 isoform X2 [Drosophila biarmipes]